MNSINTVVFFALIVSANCLISDRIYNLTEKSCNQPRLQLKPLLNLDLCRTTGDRGIEDLLCHGIVSALLDICSKSSDITLEQVINSTKMNDSPTDFCNKTGSVKVDLNILPTNVSENLKKISNVVVCPRYCVMMEGGLNPMCPFLVSFAELKNSTILKKNVSIVAVAPVKDTVPTNAKNIDKQEPVQKGEVPKANPPTEVEGKNDLGAGEEDPSSLPVPVVPQNSNYAPENNPTDVKKLSAVSKPDQGGKDPPSDLINSFNKDANVQSQPDDNPEGENEEDKAAGIGEGESPNIPVNDPDINRQNTKDNSETSQMVDERFVEAESGHFFTYFVFISALCMFFYVGMYNKKKILALLIEGRRTNVKRRPNSAAYSKLDCTLEEAMASGPSTSSSNTLLY